MPAEHPDVDVMRRFLFDELPPRERIRVERRFALDPEYFDEICALEEELIVAHLRDQLPEDWREGFARSFLASPARRERVEELGRFLAALPDSPPIAFPVRETATRRRPLVAGWALGVAAMLAVGVAVPFVWRASRPPSAVSDQRPRSAPPPAVAPPVFDVRPGTRDVLNETNLFRVPGDAPAVRLRVVLPPGTPAVVAASLRPVGGAAVPLPGATSARETATGTEVLVAVPSRLLPPGDYLIELASVAADGTREPLPGRSFSIAR